MCGSMKYNGGGFCFPEAAQLFKKKWYFGKYFMLQHREIFFCTSKRKENSKWFHNILLQPIALLWLWRDEQDPRGTNLISWLSLNPTSDSEMIAVSDYK